MPEVTLYASKSALIDPARASENLSSDSVATLSLYGNSNLRSALLVGFEAMPQNLQFKRISSVKAAVYADGNPDFSGGTQLIYAYPLTADFDESSITYSSFRNAYTGGYTVHLPLSSSYAWSVSAARPPSSGIMSLLRYGLFLRDLKISGNEYTWDSYNSAEVATSRNANRPYLVVEYLDSNVSTLISSVSPSSGYVSKVKANVFNWSLAKAYYFSYAELAQESAEFRWRAGSSGAVNTIPVSGSATTCTVPSNTFNAEEIQWQVAVTLNSGDVLTSDWITLSTVEVTSSAMVRSPKDMVVDGAAEIELQWEHQIATGTQPTGFEIQTSTDGSSWTALASNTNSSATSYTVPADTFGAGDRWWRVRTYNTDGVAGSWSDGAKFVVVSAPPTPSVVILDTSPRPAIRWQTTGQQAYEVQVENIYRSGVLFGSQQNWKSPVYLADGSYTVQVRAQNQYGMWSKWGEAALPVSNVAGTAITLTVLGGSEATLSWQTEGAYDFFLILRDGETIAKTAERTFTDHFSAGDLTYQVRGCYNASGSYGLSGEVTVNIQPESIMISPVPAAEWLPLPLSDVQHRMTSETLEREVTYNLMSGYDYPIAERGEHKERYLTVTAALVDQDARKTLEGMAGSLVCVKTPKNGAVVGVLAPLQSNTTEFYTVYNFSIRQVHWKEAVQLDS